MEKKMLRRLVLGDIHGAYRALEQVFARCNLREEDKLIVLGDVCDGWTETYECVERLLKIKNLIYILGNHDEWALNWGVYGTKPEIWTSQGGKNTIESYRKHGGMPESHIKLFRTAQVKYIEDNKLFVHGGIDPNIPLEKNDIDTLLWDRELLRIAIMKGNNRPDYRLTDFDEIYVGHTTTLKYKTTEPIRKCEVISLDTGAGWNGKLTIMDIDTKEFWQSDFVYKLYPEEKGRGD